MARALPEDWRPAARIQVGHEIHPAYGTWTEVVGKDYGTTGIRFTLADGTEFHANATQRIRSRFLPKES